jgi:hypothetical protein
MEIFKTSFWNEPIPKRKFDALIIKNMMARLKSKQKLNVEHKPRETRSLITRKPIFGVARPSVAAEHQYTHLIQRREAKKGLATFISMTGLPDTSSKQKEASPSVVDQKAEETLNLSSVADYT